jgi:hypothetical protein
MFNETQWHAEKQIFRAVTGGSYRIRGAYGVVIYGSVFPTRGTIPISTPRAGTIISQGNKVRGTGTSFRADVQEEDFIHAKNVVRKVVSVISDTLLELDGGFPTDIASPGEGLRICRPQDYKSIYAKSTGSADATALREAPFRQNDTFFGGGSPISYDATSGEISFEVKE